MTKFLLGLSVVLATIGTFVLLGPLLLAPVWDASADAMTTCLLAGMVALALSLGALFAAD